MIFRIKIALLVATFFPFAATAFAEQEVLYKGQTLSNWVSQIDPETVYLEETEPMKAIHHFGTNAVPTLIQWIKNDSTAAQAQKSAEANARHVFFGPATYDGSERATIAFRILGDEARPAIPELTDIALTSEDHLQFDAAIESLALIGNDSLPSFNIILTQGHAGAQFSALEWLAAFHTNALPVLPAAIKCLIGTNEEVSGKAADELSRLDVPRAVLIPALTNAFQTASVHGRLEIVRCLFWIENLGLNGENHAAIKKYGALSVFHSALKDPDATTRSLATRALLPFDSEVVANVSASIEASIEATKANSGKPVLAWKAINIQPEEGYWIRDHMEPQCWYIEVEVTNMTDQEVIVDWQRDQSAFQVGERWEDLGLGGLMSYLPPNGTKTFSVSIPRQAQAFCLLTYYEHGPQTLPRHFHRLAIEVRLPANIIQKSRVVDSNDNVRKSAGVTNPAALLPSAASLKTNYPAPTVYMSGSDRQ